MGARKPSSGGRKTEVKAVNGKVLSVLVVDDEIEIRDLMVEILGAAGHKVTCAPDGDSAVRLLARRAGHFDLAFLDYVMPGEDGLSVMGRLRRIDPELRVVLLTGDTELAPSPDRSCLHPYAMLRKPFSISSLEDLLREAGREAASAPPGQEAAGG